jgi:hypothetical protein
MKPIEDISTYFGITPHRARKNTPVVYCPEGTYGHPGQAFVAERPGEVVAAVQAEALAIQVYGTAQKMKETVNRKYDERFSRYSRRFQEWCEESYRLPTKPRRKPRSPKDLYTGSSFELWYEQWICRGATDLPYWDHRRQTIEPGVYCSACAVPKTFKKVQGQWQDRMGINEGNIDAFTLDTITQHFKHCKFVKMGYKAGERYRFDFPEKLGRDFLVIEDDEECKI